MICGKYRVESLLGRGSFATTYKARQRGWALVLPAHAAASVQCQTSLLGCWRLRCPTQRPLHCLPAVHGASNGR